MDLYNFTQQQQQQKKKKEKSDFYFSIQNITANWMCVEVILSNYIVSKMDYFIGDLW